LSTTTKPQVYLLSINQLVIIKRIQISHNFIETTKFSEHKVSRAFLKNRNKFKAARMSLQAKIGPSILNADLSQLADESQKLLDNGADYLVS